MALNLEKQLLFVRFVPYFGEEILQQPLPHPPPPPPQTHLPCGGSEKRGFELF